jgi:ABC-2 type transport system permease protein
MFTFVALVALIRKDVILFLNDKRAMVLTILMPILLAAFFGYVMGGSGNKDAAKIEVAVVKQDQHVISQHILKGLLAETTLHVVEMSLDEAQDLVQKGKVSVAIVLPEGFGQAAGAALFNVNSKPDLPLFYDPSQAAVLAMVKGMLTQQVMQSVSAEMMGGDSGNQFVDESLNQLNALNTKDTEQQGLQDFLQSYKKFQTQKNTSNEEVKPEGTSQQSAGLSMPFNTKDTALTAPNALGSQYNGYAHSFAGMIVQFILFMGIDAGITILLARKMGLWNRLLAAPVKLETIIAGRALSCALIAFTLIVVIYAVAIMVFKVQILGSVLGLIGIAVSFSLMTASFGLLIAAFGKTPEAARGIAIFATLVMVMLGGAWMPSFLFPQWLLNITLFIPTRWAVDGFDAMTWRGQGLDVAMPAMGVLLLFATLFAALAVWRFRAQQNDN